MFKHVFVLFALVFVLVLSGCGKAPEAEIQKSESAMQAAVEAEAEQYAPEAYKMAMDTLNAANAARAEQDSKFSLFRGYGKSKDLYMSAEVLAQKAAVMAEQNKNNVHQEADTFLTETKDVLDRATEALAKAPVGKGNKAEIELIKSDLASARTAFDNACADFEAGNYLVAKQKLQSVMDKAGSIIAEIEKAKQKKSGK